MKYEVFLPLQIANNQKELIEKLQYKFEIFDFEKTEVFFNSKAKKTILCNWVVALNQTWNSGVWTIYRKE